MTDSKIRAAVQTWASAALKPRQNPDGKSSYTQGPSEPSTLVYQDWTSCSAGFVNIDVFQRKSDQSYIVHAQHGNARFTGDDPGDHTETTKAECKTLLAVLDCLALWDGFDGNKTSSMLCTWSGYWKQHYRLTTKQEWMVSDPEKPFSEAVKAMESDPSFTAMEWLSKSIN